MATWTTAQFEDIDEINDGRVPCRPVRHHFGIASFGVNVFTGREAGDRIINEHDEDGRRTRSCTSCTRAAPASSSTARRSTRRPGRSCSPSPSVKRTAFAEEPSTTSSRVGGAPGKAYESHGFEVWAPLQPLYQAGEYERSPTASNPSCQRTLRGRCSTTTLRASTASPAARRKRSRTSAARWSSPRTTSAATPRATPTSRQSAASRLQGAVRLSEEGTRCVERSVE